MTTKDTGGPAFPTEYFYDENTGQETLPSEGMTLRDYFAAKALQGLCAGLEAGDRPDVIPSMAYVFADAMLAERSKP